MDILNQLKADWETSIKLATEIQAKKDKLSYDRLFNNLGNLRRDEDVLDTLIESQKKLLNKYGIDEKVFSSHV